VTVLVPVLVPVPVLAVTVLVPVLVPATGAVPGCSLARSTKALRSQVSLRLAALAPLGRAFSPRASSCSTPWSRRPQTS
jgi:hypothetical protein